MSVQYTEMSCGGCGCADMRLKQSACGGDIAAVCQGCGSVSHLTIGQPKIRIEWGHSSLGERDSGVLCSMDWPASPSGSVSLDEAKRKIE